MHPHEQVAEAAAAGRRVWWVWGGEELADDPSEWHPYYAPRIYTAVREVLTQYFDEVKSARFDRTIEPYRVELYAPRAVTSP